MPQIRHLTASLTSEHFHFWCPQHFQYSEIIPDVVGSFVPMTSLNLTYTSGPNDFAVDYGKSLPPSVLAHAPSVAFALEPDRTEQTLHTLMMIDPDAPFRDRPTDGERLHWLVYAFSGGPPHSYP